MFLSLFIIFTLGIFGGLIFEKIKLPKLIWFILLGILIGPSVLNIVDETLISISSYLRQIALILILLLFLKNKKSVKHLSLTECFVIKLELQ